MCSVTAKVNGQRLESCEHLKISHSTWLLGMMEAMFTPGHNGDTMFTETWRHAPGHSVLSTAVCNRDILHNRASNQYNQMERKLLMVACNPLHILCKLCVL